MLLEKGEQRGLLHPLLMTISLLMAVPLLMPIPFLKESIKLATIMTANFLIEVLAFSGMEPSIRKHPEKFWKRSLEMPS